jgi:hypothetical protein
MKSKQWRHPVNHKTERAILTPVFRATGQRLDLEVEFGIRR